MDNREKILSQDYAEFIYPQFNPGEEIVEKYRAEIVQPIANNISTLYVPLRDTMDLVFSNYNYSMMPKIFGLMDISPLEEAGVIKLQNQPVQNLKGQGTIIGIVDTGIDYLNEAFKDISGNTRILRLWDQSQNNGRLPGVLEDMELTQKLSLRLQYGSEYTEADINEAISSENPYEIVHQRDDIGHGTFVAGVAGGSEYNSSFIGAAPEAKFIVVKLKQAKEYLRDYYFIPSDVPAYQENDLIAAINYIRIYSEILDIPVSLLVAVGTNQGPHIGKTFFSRELDGYRNKVGTCVTVAAGNEGNARHHYLGRVEYDSRTDVVEKYMDTMEIRVPENSPGFSMEIWIDAPKIYEIGLVTPTGEVIEKIQRRVRGMQTIDFIFEKSKVYVEYELVEGATGDELIFVRFREPTAGIWRIRVFGDRENYGRYNCWLPITEFVGEETFFLRPDPQMTLTVPSLASGVITVAGYNSRTGAYDFKSGRGPARDGSQKPDITAPGIGITGPTLYNSFENRDGTSLAAAITCGVAADLMTWAIVRGNRENVTSETIKSYLIRGADRAEGEYYPNYETGYGLLNAINALDKLG